MKIFKKETGTCSAKEFRRDFSGNSADLSLRFSFIFNFSLSTFCEVRRFESAVRIKLGIVKNKIEGAVTKCAA